MPEKHQHGGKTSQKFIDKDEVLKLVNIEKGITILDAGCGSGYMTLEFSALTGDSGKVYAFDIHKESIDILEQQAEQRNNIITSLANITEQTELAAESIDYIYLSTVYHGFSEDEKAGFTREVMRILKPGGTLAIVEIKKGDTPMGPPQEIRVSSQQLFELIPLRPIETFDLCEHFYLQTFQK